MNIKEIWNNRSKIVEGFKNNLIKDEHIEEIAKKRLEICVQCNAYDIKGTSCAVPLTSPCCGICGCSLALKTRSLTSECSHENKKWGALLTIEEEQQFLDNLYKGKENE